MSLDPGRTRTAWDQLAPVWAAAQALVPGGRFVLVIPHPCTQTPFRRWERDDCGAKRWLCVDRYFDAGPQEQTWSHWTDAPLTTESVHATIERWTSWSLAAGFARRGLAEPRPDAATLARHPDLEDAARVPYFLVLDLSR